MNARTLSFKHFAAGIAVLLALALLLINGRPIDTAAHGRVIAQLGELNELDSHLGETVLAIRDGLITHYDPLAATLARMSVVVGELREGEDAIVGRGNADIDRAWQATAAALANKEDLVESFKSHNALLKNSLYYLPLVVDTALKQLPASDGLRGTLERMLREVLLLRIRHSHSEREEVNRALAHLETVLEQYAPRDRALIERLIQHSRNALHHQEKTDALAALITRGSNNQMGHELAEAYNRSFERALWLTNLYQALLSLLALALIVYAAYSFLRLKRNAARLAQSEDRYRRLVEVSPDAIIIDSAGRLAYANAAAVRLYAASSAEELIGKPLRDLIRPDDHDGPRVDGSGAGAEVHLHSLREQKALRLDGKMIDVEVVSAAIAFEDTSATQTVIRDITERKKAESRMAYLAQYDTLTGLPNRNLFHDRLRVALARAKRNQQTIALMFIDLDRFKEINDTLGHSAGDRVLSIIADRLREHLREVDTVARLGGDEFTVVLENITNTGQASTVAAKINEALAQPIIIDGQEIFITASVGIAIPQAGEENIDTLVKQADIAMYQAKQEGRNNLQFYSPEKHAKSSNLLSLESALRRALERDEFILHYQPKVSARNGRLAGVEALLRWNSRDFGMVPPAEFIPLAEETGLIVPIGEWILHHACVQAKRWQDKHPQPLTMAVNLSARQFRERNLTSTIIGALGKSGLDPRYLELEITESMVMHRPEEVVGILLKLRQMGLQLAIDDFGTGYSSLAYLKRFAVDTLKIDRSFVLDIERDPDDAAIVTAIISMAHNLDLKVVAEGVETREQLGFLQRLGCDECQGYYFSRPLPAHELETLLAAPPEKWELHRPVAIAPLLKRATG